MTIDTKKIRNLVKRIQDVKVHMDRFIKMYPNSKSLYCGSDRSGNATLYSTEFTNFSLYLDKANFQAEYKPNEYIKNDMSLIYDVGGSSFFINEDYDEQEILDISVLTEEYLFQMSLEMDPQVLEGMYFMAVCKEMNMPAFNTTSHCIEILEGLVDGYFIESNGEVRKTKEGSVIRIDVHSGWFSHHW